MTSKKYMDEILKNKIDIDRHNSGKRLDVFLAAIFPDYSRNFFQKRIEKGDVLVNHKIEKSRYILKIRDKIDINIEKDIEPSEANAEDIPLDIIFEDENVIVINKQAGLVVHPAAGNRSGTLVNALLFHSPEVEEFKQKSDKFRPGIVHRLDKDTSGVMIVAKNDLAMHQLSKQIQDRTVKKSYLALVSGWLKEEKGTLTSFLGRHPIDRKKMAEVGESRGREAITNYQVVKKYLTKQNEKVSLVECEIKTGRTHQIRVQLSKLQHPVLGDKVYGNKASLKISHQINATRQLLHSHKLSIVIPGDKVAREFVAPIPDDFALIESELTQP